MSKNVTNGLLALGCFLFMPTAGAWGGKPPLHTVVLNVTSNVATGSALHAAVDRPELGSMTTTGAVRMFTSGANQWVGRIAVQGSAVSTSATYRFTARTTSSSTHCTLGNGNLGGAAFTTNLPLWNPGYAGKTVFYHSTWSNVVVYYRVGQTDAWTESPVMTRLGQGRTGSEHRYTVNGIGEAGRPLEFVMRGVSNGVVQWDNPSVGGVNNNYYTSLDAFFIQDKNIYNYSPPATVSAPQVISVGSWSSSYTANGIPTRGGRIYLPRGYTQNTTKRYPVLYMHDGQNVFDPGGDYGSWSAETAATREITQGRMRETIIVAVNNTANRMSEYGTPQDGYTGNYYLLYLVNNVKPNIDSTYRTLTGMMDTGNMGSSLGGLISAYIGLSTNVFGLIGAVSPSYWYGSNFRNWINTQPTKGRRIYQDCGTDEGSDMWNYFWPVYTYYLQDDYVVNDDLLVAIGCGQIHNEAAWASRVAGAFQFLYNPWDEANLLETNAPSTPGTLQFTALATNVPEVAGSVRVWVSRTGGDDGAASVNYSTSNGTASAGADYTTTTGTLNWTNNDSATKFLDVPILDDVLYEGDETFTVRLTGATGAPLGSPAIATVTIVDNEAPPPQLAITNPPTGLVVGEATDSVDLQGTAVAANWQGLAWTNNLTGLSGVAPIADSWQIAGIGLGQGVNVITIAATNNTPSLIVHAADVSTNPAYASGWTNGSNGGIGFGSWTLFANATAGHFISGNGWGMWSQSNNFAEAIRPFAAPLAVGQRFRTRFKNGWVFEGRQGVGLALRDAGGASLVQFYFNGGDTNYTVEDAMGGRNSGIGWTDQPQTVEIELLTATTYVMRVDATVIPGTCTGSLSQARFWSWSGGEGPNYDVFCNQLEIDSVSASGSSTSATVTITREEGAMHDGIPLSWWNQYGLGTNSTAAGNDDEDDANNWEEFVADTNPTNPASVYPNRIVVAAGADVITLQAGPPTTNSRIYDVWCATDLVPGIWEPFHLDRPGDDLGGPVYLTVTNSGGIRYYRTGVKRMP
jgi:hypothetical protein